MDSNIAQMYETVHKVLGAWEQSYIFVWRYMTPALFNMYVCRHNTREYFMITCCDCLWGCSGSSTVGLSSNLPAQLATAENVCHVYCCTAETHAAGRGTENYRVSVYLVQCYRRNIKHGRLTFFFFPNVSYNVTCFQIVAWIISSRFLS